MKGSAGLAIKRILPARAGSRCRRNPGGRHCRQLWPARRQRQRHVLARPRHPSAASRACRCHAIVGRSAASGMQSYLHDHAGV